MSNTIEIVRLEQTGLGTVGVLLVNGAVQCYTLEEPWRDNQKNVSCIPAGEYKAKLMYSHKFDARLWELVDVPGRSEVKVHAGNTLRDTDGCILVGLEAGWFTGGTERAVISSRAALARVHSATKLFNGGSTVIVREA